MKTISRLKVVPKAWSYTFSVSGDTDRVAQAVDLSWWGDKGELRVGGETYTARRDKASYLLELKSSYVGKAKDGVLVRARRPRRLFRELIVEHAERQYLLRARSPFRREFQLLAADGGAPLGFVSPEGFFTRKAAVELPGEFPLFLQVFIIWLVMTLWKHDDTGGCAGTDVG